MTENNEKIVEKVRKLLEKAHSVAGTPEADIFNLKAFELMCKHGLDENVVTRKGIDKNVEDGKLLKVRFNFKDRFHTQQVELLWAIAQPLHCAGVTGATGSGREIIVFGVARHIRRVKLLHGFLSAQMLAGASKVRPTSVYDDVTQERALWMKGFADGVATKIGKVEQAAIRQFDMNCGDTRMALARKSDYERARAALDKAYPNRGRGGFKGTAKGGRYGDGFAAGNQSDVGQTKVGAGGQRALT